MMIKAMERARNFMQELADHRNLEERFCRPGTGIIDINLPGSKSARSYSSHPEAVSHSRTLVPRPEPHSQYTAHNRRLPARVQKF